MQVGVDQDYVQYSQFIILIEYAGDNEIVVLSPVTE
jgi:hypothetical protein